jgi:integral membrane sensor domain MASE1
MESGAYHGNVHARGLVADRGPLAVDPVPTIDQGSDAISVGHRASSDLGRLWRYTVELLGVAVAYFVLAKLGLGLASINPSASPIWPPTGLALASAILMGSRVGPAIFVGALLANATTTGSIHTSAAIALGNTLESLVGGYLINRWSGSHHTFGTAAGVARFALVSFAAATPISATVGVGSLSLAGYVDVADRASVWLTW